MLHTPHVVTGAYREHVGARIREARTSAGLSHDRLAVAAGMSGAGARQHLIKLEQGKHLPRHDTLAAIAAATGRDIEWFLPKIKQPRSRRQEEYRRARESLGNAA